jgi:hypothetical protein
VQQQLGQPTAYMIVFFALAMPDESPCEDTYFMPPIITIITATIPTTSDRTLIAFLTVSLNDELPSGSVHVPSPPTAAPNPAQTCSAAVCACAVLICTHKKNDNSNPPTTSNLSGLPIIRNMYTFSFSKMFYLK